MLARHFSAERINEIVNHPTIYPWIKGRHTTPLDLSNIVKNPDNVCLVGEYGCVIFIKHQSGIYEFHTSVLPDGRGVRMVEGSHFAFNWMFTKTDAFELLTKCPYGNVAAKAGAKVTGCSLRFTTLPLWPVEDKLVPIDVYSIILQEWAKSADNLVELGKWFHDQLEHKCQTSNILLKPHENDENHNRYVGATVEMLRNGQVVKAIAFYNRWAIMAGYYPIKLLSLNPVVIDIRDCILRISENDFDVTAI